MDLHLNEWTAYLFRWIHLITGISWIGNSFYFMWLDAALEKPATHKPDVEGELWMVHSGGFYEVERKLIGPGSMPKTLHWFKYEALFTWITGIILLGWVYYANANAYLVDPSVAQLDPDKAVLASAAALALSWFAYDGLWQSPIGWKKPGLATAISLALASAMAWGFCHYLSGRAAFIHMGALFGTWMVANVWVRILPAQQKMVDATKEGRTPDYALSGHAKRRSVHNTYMTFPVLFMMLSNHYPHVYSGAYNWVNLLLLVIFGATVRHVMVTKKKTGRLAAIPAAAAAIALVLLAGNLGNNSSGAGVSAASADTTPVKFQQVHAVIQARCVSCHSPDPAIKTFGPKPGGVELTSSERIKALAERIKIRAVVTKTMPQGNLTHITDEERALLGRWIDQGARIEE